MGKYLAMAARWDYLQLLLNYSPLPSTQEGASQIWSDYVVARSTVLRYLLLAVSSSTTDRSFVLRHKSMLRALYASVQMGAQDLEIDPVPVFTCFYVTRPSCTSGNMWSTWIRAKWRPHVSVSRNTRSADAVTSRLCTRLNR